MLKKVALTLASLFLIYNSFKFLKGFFQLSPDSFSALGIFFSAFVINLFITGIFAFAGFAFPTNKILPAGYYKIQNPELLNSIYNALGVKYFRAFLLLTFYRKSDNKKYFNGTKTGILLFDYNTRQSEFGHLMASICISVVAILVLLKGGFMAFMWIQLINLVFNVYPIILQRKHRISIERVIQRLK